MITPTRVLVSNDGFSLPTKKAKGPVDVVFVRDDGWMLGSKAEWEGVAYAIWKDCWVFFIRNGDEKFTRIKEYQPKET